MDSMLQRYMVYMMSGKNTSIGSPLTSNVFKNTTPESSALNSYIKSNYSNPSPAQSPKGDIDGSSPIEGTNLGINI